MITLQFLLCRIHVHKGNQSSLEINGFEEFNDMTPGEVLKRTIESRPTFTGRKNVKWSIGNIKHIDDTSLIFVIGYEKQEQIGVKDSEGNFFDTQIDMAPHTSVLLDWDLEVAGIEITSKFNNLILANRLKQLLNNSHIASNSDTEFDVLPVDNPEEFIKWLASSHKITTYECSFSRSNFRDTDADIQQPLQSIADLADGKNNILKLKNEEGLNKNILLSLTRVMILSGQKIKAKIQKFYKSKSEKRSSSGNLIKVDIDTLEGDDGKLNSVNNIRETYRGLRYGKGSE